MATKPIETYKWGENATHEQVAAYSDTGWPADNIPPKRTQFNWYQNLVGRWLGWAESAIDDIMSTVVDKWFVELPSTLISSVPNEDGIYWYNATSSTVIVFVRNSRALRLFLSVSELRVITYDYTSSWSPITEFKRSNSRSDILDESQVQYVTPRGLVDYFSVKGVTYHHPQVVPHQTGVYLLELEATNYLYGVSIVVGDNQAHIPFEGEGVAYKWENNEWVSQ